MDPITAYFSQKTEFTLSFNALEVNFDKLDPSRPLSRNRITGASRELLASCEACFEAFMAFVPWSIHSAIRTAEIGKAGGQLTNDEAFELHVFQTASEALRAGFSEIENERYQALHSKTLEIGKAVNREFSLQEKIGLSSSRAKYHEKLVTAVKASLFAWRSYQDAVYAICLIAKGQKPSEHSTMRDGLKPNAPIGELAGQCDYAEVFERFRDLRNLVKVGTLGETGGSGINPSVVFQDARSDAYVSIGSSKFSFFDLSELLRSSAQVTQWIVEIE